MTRLETLHELIQATEPEDIDIVEWNTCFAGHACNHVPFQSQGLFLNDEGVPAFSTIEDNFEGFAALAAFFGLLIREALYLFAESHYVGYISVSKQELYTLFLSRLAGIIQQRKDNYGHAPIDGRWNWYGEGEGK